MAVDEKGVAENGSSCLKQYNPITVYMGKTHRCHSFICNQLHNMIMKFEKQKNQPHNLVETIYSKSGAQLLSMSQFDILVNLWLWAASKALLFYTY